MSGIWVWPCSSRLGAIAAAVVVWCVLCHPVAVVAETPAKPDLSHQSSLISDPAPVLRACALEEVEQAVLTAAGPPGLVMLDNGRMIRLSDVLIFADEAAWQALLAPFLGRRVTLWRSDIKPGLAGDHAHMVLLDNRLAAPSIWLQDTLLATGQGAVYIYPGMTACHRALKAAEQAARQAGAGHWAHERAEGTNMVIGPQRFLSNMIIGQATDPVLSTAIGRYGIITGHVLSIGKQGRWAYLNFGTNFATDFTVRLTATAEKQLLNHGFTTKDLVNVHIEVRGVLQNRGGPLIDVFDLAQITLPNRPQTLERPDFELK